MRAQADKFLLANNIVTHNICFEDFSRDVWTDASSRVDLVLSALASDLKKERLLKLPAFCKSVLKTGSYVFLIVNEVQLITLQESFRSIGFKVCDHPFTIMFDTKTIRKRKAYDFPQRHFDIALIAKSQGLHPDGFLPEFVSAATTDEEDQGNTTYASFNNVENCGSKLKEPNHNAALFPEERSVDLFSRVIRLLAPMEGALIDPFGGPLSTCLACLQTGRSCTAMDEDSNRFRFALGRLRVFATPDASMEDHTVYSGHLISSGSSKETDGDEVMGVEDSLEENGGTPTKKLCTRNSEHNKRRRE